MFPQPKMAIQSFSKIGFLQKQQILNSDGANWQYGMV